MKPDPLGLNVNEWRSLTNWQRRAVIVGAVASAFATAFVVFLLLWAGGAFGQQQTPDDTPLERHEQTELVWHTGEERTVRWAQSCGCTVDFNKLRIYHRETGLLAFEKNDIPGDVFAQKWTPMRAGHYWIEMEACVNDDPNTPQAGDLYCSATSTSLDGQFTDEETPRGFVLYLIIPPPTEGGIEQ